ncbi:BQ2448_625 [Microbotryum intermedium]|uniref:BQ2448_625 protein n=1 Tax=Microbotryum intermedium TaxID=269621 RepID=A0A238F9G6_9BASI|nr:BQ2448_625 [Microbotryum intermedium]
MSQPLHVKIRIYDLLPPSNLSWMLNKLGTGTSPRVYHSSIQLPRRDASRPYHDASDHVEIAFGGHDVPTATGIFTLAAGTASERMPGLREYLLLDAGEAFGQDWEKEFGNPHAAEPTMRSSPRRTASSTSPSLIKLWQTRTPSSGSTVTLAGPSYAQQMSAGSTASLATTSKCDILPAKGEEVNLEPSSGMSKTPNEDPLERAWKIVDQMKSEEEWRGTKYSLLQKNCNRFTDELLYRLTGRRAPGWINRASWVSGMLHRRIKAPITEHRARSAWLSLMQVATSVPCLVPAGWVDEVDEVAPDAPTPDQPVRSAPVGQERRMVASR